VIKWLNRDLIVGPYFTLVTNERDYHRAMSRCKINLHDRPRWVTKGANATAHSLRSPHGELTFIVAVEVKGQTGIQVCAMLVHEAVHIWQEWCEDKGETNPSAEFEAYSIQALSQRLMYAYSDSLKRPASRPA
jgi:hypothetical protein